MKDIHEVIMKAREAQKAWAALPYKKRAACLRKAGKFLAENSDRVTATVAGDNGKLPIDALAAETLPAVMALGYYVKRGKQFSTPKKIAGGSILMFNKRSRYVCEPWGVVGIISPWNYPFSIPFSEVVMALLAGNAVLLKTASLTPNVGSLLAEIFNNAGLPANVFNYIEMAGAEAGPAFIGTREEPGVDKLFFTGATSTGRELAALAAPRLLPLVLELGGADAAIVREDADLDRAAAGIVWAAFSNAGQSCGGVQRVIVHQSVYKELLDKLCNLVEALRPGIDLGPMASEKQFRKVKEQITECLAAGAVLMASSEDDGKPDSLFLPAMVFTNIQPGMPLADEEVFGPVVAVQSAEDDEEALALANASTYGLSGSVWGRNRRKARALAARLNAGAVMVNDHLMSHGLAETPWGGFGDSGLGRTHCALGFAEMLKTKVVVDDILPGVKRDLFWQPYSEKVEAGIRAIVKLLSGTWGERLAAVPKVLGIFFRYWEK